MEEKKRVGKRKHLNADNNFDDSENFVGVRKRELPLDMTSAKAWAFLGLLHKLLISSIEFTQALSSLLITKPAKFLGLNPRLLTHPTSLRDHT